LRLIFDAIRDVRGVYLFDEFDSIGSSRSLSNDVGEIRRVLNSFLQLIEQDGSDSLLVAATNHADLLDHALFRRFDDVIEYHLPEAREAVALLKAKLATVNLGRIYWAELGKQAAGLSHGDLTRACEEAIKEMIIHGGERITHAVLRQSLVERRDFYQRRKV
jgi:AAA+ superfamily predicted ATPase